ncbi:MAG: non-heme iron oxygenase ferredoxin subunit [Streptosporangiaceae bacterium]|nr:non-heme iron oxygenase ferredoxin subunit [Streptosporangiaceae bacterium]
MNTPAIFIRACSVSDLPDEGVIGITVEDTPLAIVRTGGEVFALHDVCGHDELPLSDGEIYNHTIECAAHGSCFDLRTGAVTRWPARNPVRTFEAKIEGGDVLVSLAPRE